MRIEIADLQKLFPIKKSIIKKLLKDVLQIEGRMASELSIALVDDEKIKGLNRSFLGKNIYTDVIAFPWNESCLSPESKDNQIKDKICGEIVVSVQRALKMAERLGVAPEGEIYLYLIHGLLHLMGYDDKDAKTASNMHEKEQDILARLGFKTYFP